MKKTYFGKILVIGLIILFAGASGIPSIAGRNISYSQINTVDSNPVEPRFEGNTYFILLSDYTDGAGQENKWAVQLRFDSYNMVVECEYDTITLPLVLDAWVEIKVDIDLDGDWMEIYYDGVFLHEKAWTAGPNNGGDGELNIAAVDLFANGATSVYYDDLSLEEVGTGIVWSENFDSYAAGSDMHGQGGWKGWDNDPAYTAYVSDKESRSDPHSVDIKANADLVHEYSGYTSGEYVYIAYVYLPSDIGDPPGAPSIDGPTNGKAGTTYDYTFNAVDPDEDKVNIYIDWGDLSSETTGFIPSGQDEIRSHSWTEEGTYTITAYAEDETGLIGPSSTLVVTMPRVKVVPTLLQRLLEIFPNAFPMIKYILGL